ncbi:hypothetical protein [Streptomyces sp. NPDC046805]|uniref:hypothetical protein n=1 Tax=Streptomyces sp. NPDC046805 TaxID=3155134 RepID=UPI0033D1CBE7
MTEMVPPPPKASPTARRMRTRPGHMLRLYDELREHRRFTAHVLPGALVITNSGYSVATGARVRLPAHASFAVFSYAVHLLLSRHPHTRAIRARQHGGRVDLEAVEVIVPGSQRGTPTG